MALMPPLVPSSERYGGPDRLGASADGTHHHPHALPHHSSTNETWKRIPGRSRAHFSCLFGVCMPFTFHKDRLLSRARPNF